MPPEGGVRGHIPLGAEKYAWNHYRAALVSWYRVPTCPSLFALRLGLLRGLESGASPEGALPPLNAGTAEPFRVSPPEAVAYPLELDSGFTAMVTEQAGAVIIRPNLATPRA